MDTPGVPSSSQPIVPGPRRLVLVLNGYQDVMEMLRLSLESTGFAAVTVNVDEVRRGSADLKGLIESHNPAVVIFDLAPPYDHSWIYLESLRSTGPLRDLPIVLTTTNERRVREFVATDEPLIEVFGKPYDIAQVVQAVRRAAGDDPSPSQEPSNR